MKVHERPGRSVRISCPEDDPTLFVNILWYIGCLSKDGDNVSIWWRLEPAIQHQFSEYKVSRFITTLAIALRSYCAYYSVPWHSAKHILLQGWGTSEHQVDCSQHGCHLLPQELKQDFPDMFCDGPECFTLAFASPWSWINPTNALQDKVQALLRKLCGAFYSLATAILILWSAAKNRRNNLSSWIPLFTLLIQHKIRYWSLPSWMNPDYCSRIGVYSCLY
jgi:hypothetical protein